MKNIHPDRFCHERPFITRYHVLVSQYEISGSQLMGKILNINFQSLKHIPHQQTGDSCFL